MSFETAKPVTPESFSQDFQFRRPQVRYPAKEDIKQTVNISRDTKAKGATRRMQNPYAPKLSYGAQGTINQGVATGQFFYATA